MAESIRTILDTNYYNEATKQWESAPVKTHAKVVQTTDGGNVQTAIDAIPGKIDTAVSSAKAELLGGAETSANTLGKLHGHIKAIQALVHSDDADLDTIQEIANYIKANRDDLTLIGTNKVSYTDIVNTLATAASVEGKVLDARQGKVLKDAIDAANASISGLQSAAASYATKNEVAAGYVTKTDAAAAYATKGEVTAAAENAMTAAMPVISETPPSNPVNGQVWFKPAGTITI